MIARSTPLLAAALACLAAPALAQDEAAAPEAAAEAPAPEAAAPEAAAPAPDAAAAPEAPAPAPEVPAAPAAEAAAAAAPETPSASESAAPAEAEADASDAPTAARAIPPRGVASYNVAERNAWIDRCRGLYNLSAPVTGAPPDLCETYLQQYERYYAANPQAAVPGAAAGAYPAGSLGSPDTPVQWVRVPVVRTGE